MSATVVTTTLLGTAFLYLDKAEIVGRPVVLRGFWAFGQLAIMVALGWLSMENLCGNLAPHFMVSCVNYLVLLAIFNRRHG